GTPTAPDRPPELEQRDVCALSGERPGPDCPSRKREWFTPASARAFDAAPACTFHVSPGIARNGARSSVAFPAALAPWAAAHDLPDLARGTRSPTAPLALVSPVRGSVYQLDPERPPSAQVPPLRTLPLDGVTYRIDGQPARRFRPTPGRHIIEAQRGSERAETEIFYE
ncbi:MAG TPA: hypothetical protein VG963_14085, partial [Polyangiaceae bacterium]|nr:hypothetical protein [Polyangiaceae bacterium]